MADIVYVLENDQAGEHAFNFELSGSGGGSDESDGGDALEILPLHSQQSDGGQEVTYIQVIIKTLSYISISAANRLIGEVVLPLSHLRH